MLHKFYLMHYDLFNSVTSNTHNLVHVVKEINRFGPLHTISSYPFENELFQIKRMLRSGRLPLSQIVNRITEMYHANKSSCYDPFLKPIAYPLFGNMNSAKKNEEVQIRDGLTLNCRFADKWFLTKEKKIISMLFAEKKEGVFGCELYRWESAFTEPLESNRINVFKAVNVSKLRTPTFYSFSDVLCKFFAICNSSETFFVPLNHSYSL